METRQQAHVSYRLMCHIVWIPKRRWEVLKKGVDKYCEKVIRSVTVDRYPDGLIEEINIQHDHIHIIIVIPPRNGISKVVGDIKRDSTANVIPYNGTFFSAFS